MTVASALLAGCLTVILGDHTACGLRIIAHLPLSAPKSTNLLQPSITLLINEFLRSKYHL
jgi:hypothetical protein